MREIIHGQLVASDAGLHLDGMHDEVEQSPVGDELLQEGPNANIIVDLDVVPVHLLVKHVATVRIALLLQLLHVEGQRRYCVEQLHDLRLVLDVNVTQVLQVDVLALVPPVHANTVLVLHVGRQAQLLHPAQGVGVLPGQPGGPRARYFRFGPLGWIAPTRRRPPRGVRLPFRSRCVPPV
jgi:hypothetical protein